jgi:tol-pal system protein YbgF
MLLTTRTDLEDMRRDQDQLRANLENLQHTRGGAASAKASASAPSAAAPAAAEPGQAPAQRWPADPWSSPDPFGASGAPRDLNTLQPGQGVSPTGAPISAPSMGAPAAPSMGMGPQAGPMAQPFMTAPAPPLAAPPMAALAPNIGAQSQSVPGADSALAAATAAPPLPVPPAQATEPKPAGPMPSASERAPGSDIVASVRGSGVGTEPTKTAPAPMPAPAVPQNLTGTLYDQGVKAFNEGRYDEAIQDFRDYVHQQPQSAYADDAQYLIGESNLRKGQYNNAVKEFNQVVLRYASGDRSAASLLKLAEVFSKMNDQVDARLSLQKLVNRYPGSAEAAQAYKMLQEMGG